MGRRCCAVCRSRDWHKEPASGLITCSEGHVLQNYRNETTETTELGPHALRKRTLKSGRAKQETLSKANALSFHGPRARYHYFECLQLLLRKQVAALIREWKLPPEFEVVCRDVWALHLSLLPHPPSPEPYLHTLDNGGDNVSSVSSKSHDEDDPASSDSESDRKEDRETLLADLLREASQSESDGDDDAADPNGKATGKATAPTPKVRNRYEVPAGNIAVLMLACWTMRLPVMYMDFIRLIQGYKLPYLDPLRLLPPEMKRHLAKETVLMLSPRFPPNVLVLHALTSRLARLCWSAYGIHTPEVNAAPMLWRTVRAMNGNSTLYALTKSIANVLSLPLTLHPSLAPALVQSRRKDPRQHKSDNVPPELALVAALIVVLKLVYGLDGTERRVPCPMMSTDPACALPRLDDFLASLGQCPEEELFSAVGGHVNALDLGDTELDLYLDFCQRALLGNEEPDKGECVSDGCQEATNPTNANAAMREGEGVGGRRARRAVVLASGDSDAIRPGVVKIFNTLDALGSVPRAYATVLEAAAGFAGLAVDDVAGVVERLERRLGRLAEVDRKGKVAAIDAEQSLLTEVY
ncbi:hypothetical protein K439DRAFT_1326822 [Ramaria rubella]|nr:hypothetical protein K439DRAFT_1326822 [Ramaria rubella]